MCPTLPFLKQEKGWLANNKLDEYAPTRTQLICMNSRTLYKSLIWIGLISFIAGFVCEVNAIPYFRHLLIIGMIQFGIGTIIWIPIRLKKPILYPFEKRKYKSTGDALFAYLLNNFVLEFWGFCVAFGMIIVILGGSFRQSKQLKFVIAKLEESKQLTEKIGVIQDTGIIVESSIGPGNMKFEFSAYGTKGAARVSVELNDQSGEWEIKNLKYD